MLLADEYHFEVARKGCFEAVYVVYLIMPGGAITLVGPAFLVWRAAYLTLLRNNLPLFCFRAQEPFPQGPKAPENGKFAAFRARNP